MPKPMKPHLKHHCMEAAQGHRIAADLLMRILFWWPKAKARFGGYRWIAKSAAEWAQDIPCSIHKYRRAVAWLRWLGLVVTEQHIWAGRPVTFIRWTPAGEAFQALASNTVGQSASHTVGQHAQHPIHGDSNMENLQGESDMETAR
jgi:hypothetical protein